MDWLKKVLKSKTINFNAAGAAIFALLSAFGIDVPADVVAAIGVIGNIILRFITKEPISAK